MNAPRSMLAQTIKTLCLCLLVLPQMVLAACVETEGGIGGTGAPLAISAVENEGGIGGTGMLAEGGIGGTGIVGTITGFASVCINGLEVNYDAATQVSSNGVAVDIQQLAIGQLIAMDTLHAKQGMLASKIDILNAVEGVVTLTQVVTGLIEVMGQPVRSNEATRLSGIATLQDIAIGMPLKVSGYRNAAHEIIATRIELAQALPVVSIVGRVAQDSTGQYVVSGTPVHAPTSSLALGSEVLLKGQWDGQRFLVDSVQLDPSLRFAAQGKQVVVEGLVLERVPGQAMKISGFDIEYASSTGVVGGNMKQLMQGQRVRIMGQVQSGRRLQAHRIEIMRRPERVGRMFGVVPDGQSHKKEGGMARPDLHKNKQMMRLAPMHRPMQGMGKHRPMSMMKR